MPHRLSRCFAFDRRFISDPSSDEQDDLDSARENLRTSGEQAKGGRAGDSPDGPVGCFFSGYSFVFGDPEGQIDVDALRLRSARDPEDKEMAQ
jgi:hypothetical protein